MSTKNQSSVKANTDSVTQSDRLELDAKLTENNPTACLENLPTVLLPSEIQRVLRIGRNSVYEAFHKGEIPHFRVGRSIRVAKSQLLGLLSTVQEKNAVGSDKPAAHGGRRRERTTPE